MARTRPMHPAIKEALGYDRRISTARILKDWKKRTSSLCKPCWELQYCPYGPIVEDFPLLPVVRSEAQDHNEYLKGCLASGVFGDGRPLDPARRKLFREDVKSFVPSEHPEAIPDVLRDASCRVFGHVCPVFFSAEPLTETKHRRTHTRLIPRDVMLAVVRRDGQICQKCNSPVRDDEVEFDHIIPFSKGGRSTVANLRLVHRDCNRRKSDSLEEILHPSPIEHLFELKSRVAKPS